MAVINSQVFLVNLPEMFGEGMRPLPRDITSSQNELN